MADFKRDLTGAPAIVMPMPYVADTYARGEWACAGVTDGTDVGLLKSGEGIYTKFYGIVNSAATTVAGTLALETIGTANMIDTIINPFAVYEAEIYAPDTSISLAGYTSGTKTITNTCGSGKGYDNLGGGWLYATAGASDVDDGGSSIGQLVRIDSSSVSTTTQSIVLEANPTRGYSTSTDVIIIQPIGTTGVDLTATKVDGTDLDAGSGTLGTDGIKCNIWANYIKYDGVGKQILRDSHGEHATLNTLSPKFYVWLDFAASHVSLNIA